MPRQTKARKETTAGKRYPLNMRTTKDVRDRLEASAASAGRSLAQEVEARLEKSFETEALMKTALELRYGSEPAAVVLIVAEALTLAGENAFHFSYLDTHADNRLARQWLHDPRCYDQAAAAVNGVLAALRPTGEIDEPYDMSEFDPRWEEYRRHRDNGIADAETILREALEGSSKVPVPEVLATARNMRNLLGHALRERIQAYFAQTSQTADP